MHVNSNIYNLYLYKHETIKNLLIGYLIFISVNRNLETADQLTGYLVKVNSTTESRVGFAYAVKDINKLKAEHRTEQGTYARNCFCYILMLAYT